METLDKGAVEAVATLAKQSGAQLLSISLPEKINGLPSFIPVLVHPETGKVTGLHDQLAPWRTHPERKIGTAKAETLESFIALIGRHRLDSSVVFAKTDWRSPSLTAIIDYHGDAGNPDNGQHRIHYQFPLSEEWKAWKDINGEPLTQAAFAEFIEDHISDLSSPSTEEGAKYEQMFSTTVGFPNDMMQLSRGLQINSETRVKSAVKLQSGEIQIVFEEDHKSATGGTLDVPGIFILQLAPFFMGEPTRLPVRLRYRLREGVLTWTFQLYRPDLYISEQVRADLETVAKKTGLPTFEGAPEMPGR